MSSCESQCKWPCGLCTYLNYSSAGRCTMCGSSRPQMEIIGRTTDDKPTVITNAPTLTSIKDSEEKWSCNQCTYLNFPKTLRCAQCYCQRSPTTPKKDIPRSPYKHSSKSLSPPKSTGLSPPSKIHHSLPPKSSAVKVAQATPPSLPKFIPSLITSSPSVSPSNTKAEQINVLESPKKQIKIKTPPVSPSSSVIQDQMLSAHKWQCVACTYVNWPRATRCIMCATDKDPIDSPDLESATNIDSSPSPIRRDDRDCDNSCSSNNLNDTHSNPCKNNVEDEESNSTKFCEDNNMINKNLHKRITDKASPDSNYSLTNPVLLPSELSGASNPKPLKTLSPSKAEASHSSNLNKIEAEPATATTDNNYENEKNLRQLRKKLQETDVAFLAACVAVVDGNYGPVEQYLSGGGDPMRKLSSTDIQILNRQSAFNEGYTLVHLAIRFGREDMLRTILTGVDGDGVGVKRVPCYVAADLAADIRRSISASLRQRRDTFPCYCVSEIVTYSLPPEIDELGSVAVQERLWDELLDRDVQKQLEEEAPIINWALELTEGLKSRLYPLWNRTAGDCLLDSVLQATWGVFDRENGLRSALSTSLTEGSHLLYPRWREYERAQARLLDFTIPEKQVLEDWALMVHLASQPGSALDQLHIFVLCHILRRPIIVYGVKCVKSFRGEDLGFARFEGVYLPLLFSPSICSKSPIALGYTRGHFCALVAIDPQSVHSSAQGAIIEPGESSIIFLPLMTQDFKQLPVHFMEQAEIGCESSLLKDWLDIFQTDSGLLVAQQKIHKKPLAVAQMTEEWLNHYRTLAQMEGAPFSRPLTAQGYSSDGDSDEQ